MCFRKKGRAGTPSEGLCAWTQGLTHMKVWCDLTAALLDYRIGVLVSCLAGQHLPTGISTPTLQGASLSRGSTSPRNLVNHTQNMHSLSTQSQTNRQTDQQTNIQIGFSQIALSFGRRLSRLARWSKCRWAWSYIFCMCGCLCDSV